VRLGLAYDGHHEPAVGLGGEAQVHRRVQHDLIAVDPGVEFRIAAQAEDREPGQQRQEADLRRRLISVERRSEPEQLGGVHVHPDGRLRDLSPRPAELVRDRLAQASYRDPGGRLGLANVDRRVDIGADDQPPAAGAADGREVNAGAAGELPDQRRGHGQPAVGRRNAAVARRDVSDSGCR
jgi:hypothetical protein